MNIVAPLTLALILSLHATEPPPLQLRGPVESPRQEGIPDWLQKAVEEQSRHSQDNTMLMVGVGLSIAVNVVVLGTMIFRGGRVVEKVERHDVEISNLWKSHNRVAERLADRTHES